MQVETRRRHLHLTPHLSLAGRCQGVASAGERTSSTFVITHSAQREFISDKIPSCEVISFIFH